MYRYLPRWAIPALWVFSVLIFCGLWLYFVAKPEALIAFEHPTPRFVLCLGFAFFLALIGYILWPVRYELQVPVGGRGFRLAGPIALAVAVFFGLHQYMPEHQGRYYALNYTGQSRLPATARVSATAAAGKAECLKVVREEGNELVLDGLYVVFPSRTRSCDVTVEAPYGWDVPTLSLQHSYSGGAIKVSDPPADATRAGYRRRYLVMGQKLEDLRVALRHESVAEVEADLGRVIAADATDALMLDPGYVPIGYRVYSTNAERITLSGKGASDDDYAALIDWIDSPLQLALEKVVEGLEVDSVDSDAVAHLAGLATSAEAREYAGAVLARFEPTHNTLSGYVKEYRQRVVTDLEQSAGAALSAPEWAGVFEFRDRPPQEPPSQQVTVGGVELALKWSKDVAILSDPEAPGTPPVSGPRATRAPMARRSRAPVPPPSTSPVPPPSRASVPPPSRAPVQPPSRARLMGAMRERLKALRAYSGDHGRLPSSLSEAGLEDVRRVGDGFEYRPPSDTDSPRPVLWKTFDQWPQGGMPVGFSDGRIKWMESEEEFQALIQGVN